MYMYIVCNNFLKEVKEEMQSLTGNSGDQRSVCFAKDNNATLGDVRSKRNTSLITTGQAYKIPQNALDPLFVKWVDYGNYNLYIDYMLMFR